MDQQGLEVLLPEDFETVQAAIQGMTQHECLVAADLLMLRRRHNPRDRKFLVAVWRRDRLAWRNAQDAKRDKKEVEAEQ